MKVALSYGSIICLSLFFFLIPSVAIKENPMLWFAFLVLAFGLFLPSFLFLKSWDVHRLVLFGIGFRLVTMGREPLFSDDWFRFIFDGFLVSKGISPYIYSPMGWLTQGLSIASTSTEEILSVQALINKMNSPEFFSVYPPALQAVFTFPFLFFSIATDWIRFAWFYQLFFLGIEFWNLKILSKGNKTVLWLYAANPLVVLESVSQCHPEPLLVLVLLQLRKAMLNSENNTNFLINLWNLFGLCIKQSYLFVLPIVYFLQKQRQRLPFAIGTVLVCLSLFFFQFSELDSQTNFGMGLFFHSFRFHGMFEPFLYLALDTFAKPYLFLSGLLSLGIGFLLFCFWWVREGKNLRNEKLRIKTTLFYGFAFLLVFSPVVHPWYLLPVVSLAIPRKKVVHIIILYTFLTLNSYLIYSFPIWYHSLFLACIEIIGGFSLVFFRFDRFRKTTRSRSG